MNYFDSVLEHSSCICWASNPGPCAHEASALSAEPYPEPPVHGSIPGLRYCDSLLDLLIVLYAVARKES